MKFSSSLIVFFVVTVLATACGPELPDQSSSDSDLSQVGPITTLQRIATGCTLYGGAPTYNSSTGLIRTAALLSCDLVATEIFVRTRLWRDNVSVDTNARGCRDAKSCLVELYWPNRRGNQTWCNAVSGTFTLGDYVEFYSNPRRCESSGF
jgi:hypothetical protein